MKLKVENLAKIKKAEVDVKNLTLFIGQNSTNKSYMAHTIYELLYSLYDYDQSYKNEDITTIISELIVLKSNEFILKSIVDKSYIEETHSSYTQVIFEFKDEHYKAIYKDISEKINKYLLKKINSSFYSKFNILDNLSFEPNIQLEEFFTKKHFEVRIYNELENIDDNLMLFVFYKDIINFYIKQLKDKICNYYDIQYFPASRSGFMLAFDEIVSGLIRDKYRGQTSSAKLTKPTIDFITKYSDIKTSNLDIKNIMSPKFRLNDNNEVQVNTLIGFLEKNLIKGKIKEYKSDENYRNYYLETGEKTKLDLHIISSSTLEILPFIVFLKDNTNIKKSLFVIEEPEAHLHPKAQIQMARFIVMLVNSGAKVLVTTHSDYILGEINNCIKKYELQEDGISISQDNVSAYLFKNKENETVVKELDIDKFGVSDENFEEALDELLEESGNLTDRILDNE